MIRLRPEKDLVNPPGQIVNPIPDAITEHNIKEWKKYEESRKQTLTEHKKEYRERSIEERLK